MILDFAQALLISPSLMMAVSKKPQLKERLTFPHLFKKSWINKRTPLQVINQTMEEKTHSQLLN
jgi:hypothetical protein